jgi:DNA-binding response OmpR family regulator
MKCILIVDDEVDIADTLASYLEMNGYKTFIACDGLDGLHKALERGPDLIITDLMMPRMDGDELIARLRSTAETSAIPVITVSASRAHGRTQFLRKPFLPDTLLALVELLIGPGDP